MLRLIMASSNFLVHFSHEFGYHHTLHMKNLVILAVSIVEVVLLAFGYVLHYSFHLCLLFDGFIFDVFFGYVLWRGAIEMRRSYALNEHAVIRRERTCVEL